jgi:hypothetical protein
VGASGGGQAVSGGATEAAVAAGVGGVVGGNGGGVGGSGGAGGVKRPLIDARDVFRRGGPKATRLDPSLATATGVGGGGGHCTVADGSKGNRNQPPPLLSGDAHAHVQESHAAASASASAAAAATTTTTSHVPHPDGSLARHPVLADKLRALSHAWSAPMGAHPNNLSVAVWRPLLGVAQVLRLRGKQLMKYGYTAGGKTYLHPEEVGLHSLSDWWLHGAYRLSSIDLFYCKITCQVKSAE